eukprot:scaffold33950_cov78-Phaeocystis_antarctica.AAC.9
MLHRAQTSAACRGPTLWPSDHRPLFSRLGPRVPEHDDLVSINARDVDLVAVHKDCSNLTSQIDAKSVQDVA